MGRIGLPVAAGALIAAGVLGLALSRLEAERPAVVPSRPAAAAATFPAPLRAPAPEPERASAIAPPVPAASAAPAPQPAAEKLDRAASSDLLALEDQALRRIDIAPILESSGVDVRALAKRPEGEDVLRHAAADELLTRAFMRDMLSLTVYPTGYPEDHALAEARGVAQGIIAKLSPEDRASTLQRALAGSSDVPHPYFYPAGSGHDFDGHLRGEAAPN